MLIQAKGMILENFSPERQKIRFLTKVKETDYPIFALGNVIRAMIL